MCIGYTEQPAGTTAVVPRGGFTGLDPNDYGINGSAGRHGSGQGSCLALNGLLCHSLGSGGAPVSVLIPAPVKDWPWSPGDEAGSGAKDATDRTSESQVGRPGPAGGQGPRITLEQARTAAEGNGFDTRMISLEYEAGEAGFYGSTKYTGSNRLSRGADGRFRVMLTYESLVSEQQSVNTIAHDVNHIRESLRTGTIPIDEEAATREGNLVQQYFRA